MRALGTVAALTTLAASAPIFDGAPFPSAILLETGTRWVYEGKVSGTVASAEVRLVEFSTPEAGNDHGSR
jgi:hypothetical protein